MKPSHNLLQTVLFFCYISSIAILSNCSSAAEPPEAPKPPPQDELVAVASPTNSPEPTAGVTPEPQVPASILPASLYFIDPSEQIARLSIDGKTLTTVTSEPAPITDFDVSSHNGIVVFVSGNQLIRTDWQGNGRTMLVDVPKVVHRRRPSSIDVEPILKFD